MDGGGSLARLGGKGQRGHRENEESAVVVVVLVCDPLSEVMNHRRYNTEQTALHC